MNLRSVSFHLVSLVFGVFGSRKNVVQKNKRQKWTNKENWISSSFLALLQGNIMFTEQTTVWASAFLESTTEIRPERICRRCAWPSSFHTWTCHCCTLNNFYKKKAAISYLQTCNINLVFLSLVYYSSTNKGKTGKSYTSVVHGLHTSQLLLWPTEIWLVQKCR